ncbi:MAG: hypothetical protein R2879_22070 [Saprospiraceae bacterium]
MQDLLTKGIDEQAATSAAKPPMLSRIVLWEGFLEWEVEELKNKFQYYGFTNQPTTEKF